MPPLSLSLSLSLSVCVWTIPARRTIVEPEPWHDPGNTEAQFTRSYLDEVGESEDPLVYFNAEWPVADRNELARKANLYRLRKMHEDRPPFYRETANHNRPWPPKYLEKMKPTNENEISRLIAFQMSMGLVPLSSFTDYWSTDPAYSSGRYFSQLAGLSRDRYQSLLSILCLYHPNDIADPRWKGCHLWYKCGAELERLNEFVRPTSH